MKHTCTLSARIEKHLYVPRRAHCEKYYNAKYILIMTMFTNLFHKCVMHYFSFMVLYCWKKIRSFDGI